MRLDKFLSNMGMGTRTEVSKLLARGMVTVNGSVIKQGKQHIDPDKDQIKMGDRLVSYVPKIYLMLNKPQGYISATEDRKMATVLDLVPQAYKHYDLFPAGRLDRDTVGLLMLTNDGTLAHQLLSPKYHVGKTYRVTGINPISDQDLQRLEQGVHIGANKDYLTLPARAQRCQENLWAQELMEKYDAQFLLPRTLDLTIQEGKYHQVKEMFLAIDNEVVFLERVTFGPLKLDVHLKRGEIRLLTDREIESLAESASHIDA